MHFLANTIGSDQPLLNGVIPFICMNIEMHYGLMAATMPTLKPFVKAFNTGWGTYDTQGVGGYGQQSNDTHAMESLGKRSSRKASKQPSPAESQGKELEFVIPHSMFTKAMWSMADHCCADRKLRQKCHTGLYAADASDGLHKQSLWK